MKFIEPSVEYWKQEYGVEGIWKQIARATRVSYQSSVRQGESDEDFVKRVVLKPALIEGDLNDLEHCKFDNNKLHGSCLEFGTIYLRIPFERDYNYTVPFFRDNYTKCYYDDSTYPTKKNPVYVTTNMRVIIENNLFDRLEYLCKPTEYHAKRYTFCANTDIGVSREGNRNRHFSILEESTRYCCYDRGKFNSEISYARPTWLKEDDPTIVETNNLTKEQQQLVFKDWCEAIAKDEVSNWDADSYYRFGLMASEFAYMGMRANKEIADHCRQVLNLNTKTQVVYCAFKEDWEHFLLLRADNYSGKAHPNINLIANKIKQLMQENDLI